jgi:hypothetical protein
MIKNNRDGIVIKKTPGEEHISFKRLAAVAWTAFRIQCQELVERSHSGGAHDLD